MANLERRGNDRAWSLAEDILGMPSGKLKVIVPMVAERMGVDVPVGKPAGYALLREFVEANGQNWLVPGGVEGGEPRPTPEPKPQVSAPAGCTHSDLEVSTAEGLAARMRDRGLDAEAGAPSEDGRAHAATVTVSQHGVPVVHYVCETRIEEYRGRPSQIDGAPVWYVGTGGIPMQPVKDCAADLLDFGGTH